MTLPKQIPPAARVIASMILLLAAVLIAKPLVYQQGGWTAEMAQSAYWCGITRESRKNAGLSAEMPNHEAECSSLEARFQSGNNAR